MSTLPSKIGPYEIRKRLGDSGMSEVYLAYDPTSDREVIIKRLRDQDLNNKDFLVRFTGEAAALGRLESDTIVPMYGFNNTDERPYIVMRFMKGGSLKERLASKPLALDQIVSIMERVAKALDLAHNNKIIHRDLKPSNILFDENNNAFLSDFGLSKKLDVSKPITQAEETVGTILYMSPEQMTNPKTIDHRSDIYSLGVVFYEMLTGVNPYSKSTDTSNLLSVMNTIIGDGIPQLTTEELNALNLPSECNAILRKAMAKDRNSRYENVNAMAKDVVRLQNSSTVVSYKHPSEHSLQRMVIYWFARNLDKRIYGGLANKAQFEKLLPWSVPLIFSLLFFGSVTTITLNTYLPILLAPQPSAIVISSASATFKQTPTSTPTITFTPTSSTIFNASIVKTAFCHLGPNNSLVGAVPLSRDMRVEILAISDSDDWFMIRSKPDELSPCWVEIFFLNFTDDFDPSQLLVFTTLILNQSTYCWDYPDVENHIHSIVPPYRRIVAYGKNDDATWILVVPHDSTTFCWIKNETDFDYPSLLIEPPDYALAPTATTTLTPTSTQKSVTPVPLTKTRRPDGGGETNQPTATAGSVIIVPTNTPGGPAASNTPLPPATNTSAPPTNTLAPSPTNTPVPPPTNTPQPTATATLCWPPGHCK
jgi:serine/threonine protein kinase